MRSRLHFCTLYHFKKLDTDIESMCRPNSGCSNQEKSLTKPGWNTSNQDDWTLLILLERYACTVPCACCSAKFFFTFRLETAWRTCFSISALRVYHSTVEEDYQGTSCKFVHTLSNSSGWNRLGKAVDWFLLTVLTLKRGSIKTLKWIEVSLGWLLT